MYCNTKLKIAQALRQLMEQRPLSKITVQDLMECTQMKRQSFYYHFQDIYDVLLWAFEQQLGQTLREDPELPLEEWCVRAMTLIEQDRAFYCRAFSAPEQVLLRGYCEELIWPRISRRLYLTEDKRELSRQQVFTVDFYTRSAVIYFVERVTSRKAIDPEEACRCMCSVLESMRTARSVRLCTKVS